ncbi:MAG: maleylpyruvate isomerase family mycothiol-dependent enzyme [Dehalococcoidia bacterium]
MHPLPPVHTIDLFAPERDALIALLESLAPDEWDAPTVCAGWSVKDIAAHILADDFGNIARGRDGYRVSWFDAPSWEALLDYINRQNEAWVDAMRRVSPRLIRELLRFSGERFVATMRARDLDAIGDPVSWAGPEPAPVRLDVAREYTERWLHQQQIRDAVGRPGLKNRSMFGPVLDTFVRALPFTYRDVVAADGTHVRLIVEGEAGGAWSLLRHDGAWALVAGIDAAAASKVMLDQETAWRLFTKGITPEAARERATIDGDVTLGAVALTMASIIA